MGTKKNILKLKNKQTHRKHKSFKKNTHKFKKIQNTSSIPPSLNPNQYYSYFQKYIQTNLSQTPLLDSFIQNIEKSEFNINDYVQSTDEYTFTQSLRTKTITILFMLEYLMYLSHNMSNSEIESDMIHTLFEKISELRKWRNENSQSQNDTIDNLPERILGSVIIKWVRMKMGEFYQSLSQERMLKQIHCEWFVFLQLIKSQFSLNNYKEKRNHPIIYPAIIISYRLIKNFNLQLIQNFDFCVFLFIQIFLFFQNDAESKPKTNYSGEIIEIMDLLSQSIYQSNNWNLNKCKIKKRRKEFSSIQILLKLAAGEKIRTDLHTYILDLFFGQCQKVYLQWKNLEISIFVFESLKETLSKCINVCQKFGSKMKPFNNNLHETIESLKNSGLFEESFRENVLTENLDIPKRMVEEIPTFEPAIDESFLLGKKFQAPLRKMKKLQQQVKKEKRGAMKELKKDTMAIQQIKHEEANQRSQKRKEDLVKSRQMVEFDIREMQKMKTYNAPPTERNKKKSKRMAGKKTEINNTSQ